MPKLPAPRLRFGDGPGGVGPVTVRDGAWSAIDDRFMAGMAERRLLPDRHAEVNLRLTQSRYGRRSFGGHRHELSPP